MENLNIINNKYEIYSDVKILLETKKIILIKGIWNKITIEITDEGFNQAEWRAIINTFERLALNKIIWKKDIASKQLLDILEQLKMYFVVYDRNLDNSSNKNDLIIADYNYKNLAIFQTKVANYEDAMKMLNEKNDIKKILVILDEYDENKYLHINKLAFSQDIQVFYALRDGFYIHLVCISDYNMGCFECVLKRFISRIKIETENIKTNFNIHKENDEINYLIYLCKLIFNSSDKYQKMILNNIILSIYLSTFEIHTDNILKVSFCDTCGHITKNQAKEQNLTLVNYVNKAVKDND